MNNKKPILLTILLIFLFITGFGIYKYIKRRKSSYKKINPKQTHEKIVNHLETNITNEPEEHQLKENDLTNSLQNIKNIKEKNNINHSKSETKNIISTLIALHGKNFLIKNIEKNTPIKTDIKIEKNNPKVSSTNPVDQNVKDIINYIAAQVRDSIPTAANINGESILNKEIKTSPILQTNKTENTKCCLPEINRNLLFLGKRYNHTLVELDWQKNWITNISFCGSSTSKAYNSCGKVVPLSNLLFGCFTIEDIFLLSKLSNEKKIYLFDACILTPKFKNRRVDQYLAYIAPFNVNPVSCQSEKGVNFSAIYRFGYNCEDKVICSLGFNLPIKSITHNINLNFTGVNQKENGFTDTELEFVVNDFNKNYINIYDFFCREILKPKGLCLDEKQNKTGVGDITFFALFDIAQLFRKIDGFQINLDLTVPSGGKYKGQNVWEIVLGNGGAYQLGLSADFLVETSKNYFNPSASIGGRFAFEFNSWQRVPKLKSSDVCPGQKLENLKDLIVPVFKSHSTKPFCQYDSCVKYFADQAFPTKTKLGSIFYLSLGNYFYNLFNTCFKLNIFYDFLYKGKDSVKVCGETGTFNTNLLENCTDIKTHQISWNLGYVNDCGIEINFGSKYIVAGKNVPKLHEYFVSLVANF